MVIAVLSVLFYVYNDNKRNNEKRIAQNMSLYKSDLQRIQILEKKYNEATNKKKIYIRFLQKEHSASIQNYISSLKDVAYQRFDNVREDGEYCQLVFNEDSINTEIKELVSDAEECIKKEDNERRLSNTKSFGENLNVVDELQKYIDEKKQLNQINETLQRSQSKKRSIKVTTPSPQKRRASSERNLTRQSYMDLVRQADQDYKSFFYSNKNDKGAAQRAIMKYQKAQSMTFDSKIDVRIKKLQKEIQ